MNVNDARMLSVTDLFPGLVCACSYTVTACLMHHHYTDVVFLLHVHGLCTTCRLPVYYMCTTCALPAHDLLTTCLLLVYYFYRLHDLSTTCLRPAYCMYSTGAMRFICLLILPPFLRATHYWCARVFRSPSVLNVFDHLMGRFRTFYDTTRTVIPPSVV